LTLAAFLVAFIAIVTLARKNLALGLFAGGIVLGILTMSTEYVLDSFLSTLSDSSVLTLMVVVAFIPMIGGLMNACGLLDALVENMRIGRRTFLAFGPAIVGLLPMPGGALMSAPLVEKAGKGISGAGKAAINVWFRHVLLLVYPIAPSLIISVKVAQVGLYSAVLVLLPFVLFATFIGYFFLLRPVKGTGKDNKHGNIRGVIYVLAVLGIAPLVDAIVRMFLKPEPSVLATLVGVLTSMALLLWVSRPAKEQIFDTVKHMKPWSFSLLILGLFFFLNVFKSSPTAKDMVTLPISELGVLVLLGFILALLTGRIEIPISMVIPIYLVKLGSAVPLFAFALLYFSAFLGFMVSPVHACVAVSLDYFKTDLNSYLKMLIPPTVVALLSTIILSMLV
jgi:integral membrane protein (TIGR00529 family)